MPRGNVFQVAYTRGLGALVLIVESMCIFNPVHRPAWAGLLGG